MIIMSVLADRQLNALPAEVKVSESDVVFQVVIQPFCTEVANAMFLQVKLLQATVNLNRNVNCHIVIYFVHRF